MMSNSNYSIGLQRLKPVHTAYCGLHNLAENWSWARDVNGRDRDETLVRLETVSRPRRRDREHNPDVSTCILTSRRHSNVLSLILSLTSAWPRSQ